MAAGTPDTVLLLLLVELLGNSVNNNEYNFFLTTGAE